MRSFGCALFIERKGYGMKKTTAMLLALVMLLSLCACSNNDSQTTDPSNSSQATTEGKENHTDSTEGTTGTTQAPTDEPTTAPTNEPTTTPTEQPTSAPTTEPPHTHNFNPATCTTPKTCSCGATEGNAAGHSWNNATCTAPKTCSKCGATEGNAAGHSYKDATCTAPKTCSKCGTTSGSAVEHKYTDGKCSTCGKEDIVNPKEYFNPVDYVSFEIQEHGIWIVQIFWDGSEYVVASARYVKTVDNPDLHMNYIDYKGERYYLTGCASPSFTYRLTDTYVEFLDPDNSPCAKYALQHDGALRKLESRWTLPSLFHKGTLDELLSKLN